MAADWLHRVWLHIKLVRAPTDLTMAASADKKKKGLNQKSIWFCLQTESQTVPGRTAYRHLLFRIRARRMSRRLPVWNEMDFISIFDSVRKESWPASLISTLKGLVLNYCLLADLAAWTLLWSVTCGSSISMLMNAGGGGEGQRGSFVFRQSWCSEDELCD